MSDFITAHCEQEYCAAALVVLLHADTFPLVMLQMDKHCSVYRRMRLVCKRWRQLLATSQLMQHFRINLINDNLLEHAKNSRYCIDYIKTRTPRRLSKRNATLIVGKSWVRFGRLHVRVLLYKNPVEFRWFDGKKTVPLCFDKPNSEAVRQFYFTFSLYYKVLLQNERSNNKNR